MAGSIDERLHREDSELLEAGPESAGGELADAPTPAPISNADIAARAVLARAARHARDETDEAQAERGPRQFVGDLPPLPPPPGTKAMTTADEPDDQGKPDGSRSEADSDVDSEPEPASWLAPRSDD